MSFFHNEESLPVILQAEAAECGLACIAMISGYYGYHVDLSALRRSHPVGAGGATLKKVLDLATDLGLSGRPLKLELGEVNELKLPAILHWDLNHFVVLQKVRGKKVVIHDPAAGRRVYKLEEISRHFTGIATEFVPSQNFKKADVREINRMRDLFTITPGFYKSVSMVLLLSFFVQLTGLAIPFYLLLTIDLGLSRSDQDWLLILAMAFLMLHLSKAIVVLFRGYAVMYLANNVGTQMVLNVFQHFIRLPMDFFLKRNMSDLMSRFNSIDSIRTIIIEDLLGTIVDGIFSVVTLTFLFVLSPKLFLVTLGTLCIFIVFRLSLRPFQREKRARASEARASQTNRFMSKLSAIRLTKMYCNERDVFSEFQNEYSSLVNAEARQQRFKTGSECGQAIIFGIDQVITMYYGAVLVTNLELSLGQYMSYIFLKMALMATMGSFGLKILELHQIKYHLQRISDITFEKPEFDQLSLSPFRVPVEGSIEVKDISYGYPGFDKNVIEDLSFSIVRGELIALQGPSGSGKTTMLKLLAGLIFSDKGTILIDGVDMMAFGIREYRNNVATVFHSDRLLQGSLEYNITLSQEIVDIEHLHFAAKLARVHGDILDLPMQYATQANDMSSLLSAGQIQRLLIARAIYKQPRILLLDEATSNLTNDMAVEILKDILGLGITVILTTHNPEVLKLANRVVKISNTEAGVLTNGSLPVPVVS